MKLFFKNTMKDIIKTEEDEKHHGKFIICSYCEKDINSNRVRDHCHLKGKNRSPAYEKWNTIVEQK